ncbi:MAG: hypothetical protein AAF289_13125 [Cyanobacteria bacterium P01_A01_bin.135]
MRPCRAKSALRLALRQRDFETASGYRQRALLLARQIGDGMGETNAIANLGYAEVRQVQRQGRATMEMLEAMIQRLERGVTLAEKYKDL